MKVEKKNQVFNLFDTNGRRNDVINAYKIYTNILEEIYQESETEKWGNYPNETTQFRFYELAIERSPEVFKKHPKYDNFMKAMEDPEVYSAFEERDIEKLKNDPKLNKLYEDLDTAIEKRARHYTSNLVKIGLADERRQITPVGRSWIQGKRITRDEFEEILPIDDTNLMFLRQILKLRVYTKDGSAYYSPMLMAMYTLLNNKRVSQDLFLTIIQMMNPYLPINPTEFVEEFLDGNSQRMERNYIPITSEEYENLQNEGIPMLESNFSKYFYSGKSQEAVSVYREFYITLINFNNNRNESDLEKLVTILMDNKKRGMINKAFNFGRDIFRVNQRDPLNISTFLEMNNESEFLTNEDLNDKLYLQFQASKRHDNIQEYGDVTKRLMKVTGIISFKNGIVELKYRSLWEKFFKDVDIENMIFCNVDQHSDEDYEKKVESPYLNHLTLGEIFNYNNEKTEEILEDVKEQLDLSSVEEVKSELLNATSKAFNEHINENFPREKVLEILPLFSDRRNDLKIQRMVAENTDVPTIFEYIVGIAWYHISSRKFDLFSSLNLSMSADFEPETHAGGGSGDIIIEYDDYILMLEVTMMNKYAQKRGEWEPVLRHATNLTIDSEDKDVVTFFIADELDSNTINIWRAVATVPLESSRSKNKFAKSVRIMPLRNVELFQMLQHGIDDTELLNKVKESFDMLSSDFDMNWRNDILNHFKV